MRAITIDRGKAVLQDAAPAAHFSGKVYLQRLSKAAAAGEIEISAVFFESGGRNKPHIHAKTQYLQIMEGTGVVATDAGRRIVRAGDLVIIPGGAWHWHGATRDSAMMHLSIRTAGDSRWDVDPHDWEDY
jgi:quercetin dioxygenase-like cupin family protein